MRYSLLGMFGLTALVALLAAVQRALGTVAAATVVDALWPFILWFILLFVEFESTDSRLSFLRFGMKVGCVTLILAPIMGILPIEMLFIQITVMVFFWMLQYMAIVSWTE